jgi:hypothetical protein
MIRTIACLPPVIGPRLPVNFDSSQAKLSHGFITHQHCAQVVNEMQGERY